MMLFGFEDTPDDGRSFRVVVYAMKEPMKDYLNIDISTLSDDDILADFKIRQSQRVNNPGLCASPGRVLLQACTVVPPGAAVLGMAAAELVTGKDDIALIVAEEDPALISKVLHRFGVLGSLIRDETFGVSFVIRLVSIGCSTKNGSWSEEILSWSALSFSSFHNGLDLGRSRRESSSRATGGASRSFVRFNHNDISSSNK